jgi:hypothetical protein
MCNVQKVTYIDYDSEALSVTTCKFCACPFPFHNIIIYSCCHLYHPWCANIWFKKKMCCKNPLCEGLVHLDWHMNFGFIEFDIQLEEKYVDMYCELAHFMIAQQRWTIVLVHFPTIGKFINLLAFFHLLINCNNFAWIIAIKH